MTTNRHRLALPLLLLLLPAVSSCGESQPAARSVRANKLRSVAIAVHEFHDSYRVFPPGNRAVRDESGRPLLSWRVHLLPHLEQRTLYNEFHLDEPWDSEHNKTLLAKMPDVFALNNNLPEGMTDVIAPYGPATPQGDSVTHSFASIQEPFRLASLGAPNTVLLVEAAPEHAVPWTKPDDFQFDADAANATARFGQPDVSIFQAAMADASIRQIPKSIKPEILGWLFHIDDDKVIDWDDIE